MEHLEAWSGGGALAAWWEERIIGALVSYCLYQHLGNLSPAELERGFLFTQQVRAADDGELAAARVRVESGPRGRWEFLELLATHRSIAGCSFLTVREGRVLRHRQRAGCSTKKSGAGSGDAAEAATSTTSLMVSTLPVLLSPTLHYVEAWNEAVCDGAWGKLAARIGEKVRRAIDLEHWAAFQDSFHRLVRTLEELASGRRGRPPASIVLLGGDIHQAYVAEVAFRDAAGAKSHVYQAVCSPFRHPLSKRERTAFRVAQRSRALRWLTQRMAHSAGVRDPTVRWRALQEPTFDNQVAWVRLDGRQLSLTIERVRPGDGPELEATFERRLA